LPLEQVELADASDCWLRHILEGDAVRVTAPRLKAKYFANRLEFVTDRPWQAELSGRLLSLALDIAERAEKEALKHPSLRFRHVAYIGVVSVRQEQNWDVFAEPNDDQAHANLVAYNIEMAPVLEATAEPKISHAFIKGILDRVQVCEAANLEPLTILRI
jgi:hypothetical protein